ncbi:TetR/AcrR family transcriptional regulator [Paenibacillus sp. MWE-103]|uniref:TetR/AcrR family transcriptional regulator n=1 Tax=Paenibacillus artemisiicola TaxID=1172618 RepID=A0ABS3WD51_9BACL|nr:TetR/AcrR family transcriptional regulator [Paenibacillus artemisiicola]MBO7746202.1 TetR/AcrR family transcriptional regulator [Paenibacillus artemisiicola]
MDRSAKTKYFELILPHIRKRGFSYLKIDEILKYLNISKATFYKHFSSRDDLIEQLVIEYASRVVDVDPIVLDDKLPFGQRFQRIFEQALLSVLIMTDEFYSDIKQNQPALIAHMTAAQTKRCDLLQQFYREGFDKGVFHAINPVVFFLQDDPVLRRLTDPFLLNYYDTTLKQQFLDYYAIKKVTLFKGDFLNPAEDGMDRIITDLLKNSYI